VFWNVSSGNSTTISQADQPTDSPEPEVATQIVMLGTERCYLPYQFGPAAIIIVNRMPTSTSAPASFAAPWPFTTGACWQAAPPLSIWNGICNPSPRRSHSELSGVAPDAVHPGRAVLLPDTTWIFFSHRAQQNETDDDRHDATSRVPSEFIAYRDALIDPSGHDTTDYANLSERQGTDAALQLFQPLGLRPYDRRIFREN